MAFGSSVALATTRLVQPVEGIHRAVFDRVMSMMGPLRLPVEAIHGAIADVVYGSIRLGTLAAGVGLDATPLSGTRMSDAVTAVASGLWGDDLGVFERRLATPFGIRDSAGALVPSDELGEAFPGATRRVAVLVHGLAETERCWADRDSGPGMMTAIEQSSGVTPVAVRFNSGLRISQNGAELADLLEETFASWPVGIESLSLVGHSMGGLVIRAACLSATERNHRWVDAVDRVVTLGTPHVGAPAEKAVNVLAWGLGQLAESRPIADYLNGRSAGVKDLRYGAIAESDWAGFDPDALLVDTVGEHPLPEHITSHFVAGVITEDPDHPVGAMMGDLLVRKTSASGGPKLVPHDVTVLGRMHHFDLLNHPEVLDRVVGWLGAPAL